MYAPPPKMEKLKSQVNITFWFSGQSDILVLADIPPPPPEMEKLKSQVNMTFWFSGQSDILVLANVSPPPEWKNWNLRSMWHFGSGWCNPPLPEIEIGLNMNAIEQK